MGRNNTDKSLQQTKQPLAQRVKKEVQRSWPMVCEGSSGNYFGFNLLLCTDGWFGYGISKL